MRCYLKPPTATPAGNVEAPCPHGEKNSKRECSQPPIHTANESTNTDACQGSQLRTTDRGLRTNNSPYCADSGPVARIRSSGFCILVHPAGCSMTRVPERHEVRRVPEGPERNQKSTVTGEIWGTSIRLTRQRAFVAATNQSVEVRNRQIPAPQKTGTYFCCPQSPADRPRKG